MSRFRYAYFILFVVALVMFLSNMVFGSRILALLAIVFFLSSGVFTWLTLSTFPPRGKQLSRFERLLRTYVPFVLALGAYVQFIKS